MSANVILRPEVAADVNRIKAKLAHLARVNPDAALKIGARIQQLVDALEPPPPPPSVPITRRRNKRPA